MKDEFNNNYKLFNYNFLYSSDGDVIDKKLNISLYDLVTILKSYKEYLRNDAIIKKYDCTELIEKTNVNLRLVFKTDDFERIVIEEDNQKHYAYKSHIINNIIKRETYNIPKEDIKQIIDYYNVKEAYDAFESKIIIGKICGFITTSIREKAHLIIKCDLALDKDTKKMIIGINLNDNDNGIISIKKDNQFYLKSIDILKDMYIDINYLPHLIQSDYMNLESKQYYKK